jgi:signal transduction histidine kinase
MKQQQAAGPRGAQPSHAHRWRDAWRFVHLDPFATDGLLAVVLLGLGMTGLLTGLGLRGLPWRTEPPTALAALLLVGQTMPLAWRRRAPLQVLAVVEASAVAYFLLGYAPTVAALGALLAFGTVAARHPTQVVLPFAAGFAVGLLVLTDQGRMSFDLFVLLHVVVAGAWMVGYEQRARRVHLALVSDRAARLERELGYLAREAVADERVRLTRELHQTITNNVSMMVTRAKAVARALPAADDSRDVLGFILKTGEQTLSELRRGTQMLSLADPPLAPADPRAAMSQLSALVTEVKMAGLPIDVTVEGDAVPLPAEVEGSAYRIVQEALTTCFKRQGSARPQVVIRYRPDDLELRITEEPGSGWELVPDGGRYENLGWMQRREAEPEALLEGGYGVLARLPLGSARS